MQDLWAAKNKAGLLICTWKNNNNNNKKNPTTSVTFGDRKLRLVRVSPNSFSQMSW